jgi:hypothetical protein
MACNCAVCAHAPTSLRRLRCKRAPGGAYPDQLHTSEHVDWQPKLLPGSALAPTVLAEEAALPPLRRLGYELPVLALLALAVLLLSSLERSA